MKAKRPLDQRSRWRGVTRAAGSVGLVVSLLLGLLAGFGWVYVLRGLGWLGGGPQIADSLPLLQLAGFDGQPLLRVVVAWVLAGVLAGLPLVRVRPARRALITGALGLVALLLASQAASALTHNLRFSDVVWHRAPGPGPWLEALCFAVGCSLPQRLVGRQQGPGSRPIWGRLGDRGHLGLSLSQQRDAPEHDRNRGQMGDDRDRIGA